MRLLTRMVGGPPGGSKASWRFGGSGVPFTQSAFWSLDAPTLGGTVGERETIDVDFESVVADAYRSGGVVYACVLARQHVFSQARFLWQRRDFTTGRPAGTFGNADLELIEHPWRNGTTSQLLARMEQDDSLAGNFYGVRVDDRDGRRLRRLRPDWTTIVVGSRTGTPNAYDSRVLAYIYKSPGDDPVTFTPDEIVHYASDPDPVAQYRGQSWISHAVRDILGDRAATEHKLAFFRNGANPSLAVSYDKDLDPDDFEQFVDLFRRQYEGVANAYKTLHLGGGADPTPLSANFQQLELKATQGAGETRIAAAAGAHPVIVGLSEGMQGSSLNAGNFHAARRLFVDRTIRYLWAAAAPALESVLPIPDGPGVRLTAVDHNIPFLRQDAAEEADIRQTEASTIVELIREGYEPDSAVEAVQNDGDWSRLVHTGLRSVQLHDDEGGPGGLGGGDTVDDEGSGTA